MGPGLAPIGTRPWGAAAIAVARPSFPLELPIEPLGEMPEGRRGLAKLPIFIFQRAEFCLALLQVVLVHEFAGPPP